MLFVILAMYLSYKNNRFFRWIWCRFALKIIGVSSIEVLGVPDPSAKLFVINHRTLLDIITVEAVLPKTTNPCWIAKKEIAKIPIFGRILDAPKMITIDRENSREMIKLLKMVEVPLGENRPLMIFPEGTRNKGDTLLKFKLGAKMLAEKHNLSVQPVVIYGADQRFNMQNGITTGKVTVAFLPLADPSSENWYEKLEKDMNEQYQTLNTKENI